MRAREWPPTWAAGPLATGTRERADCPAGDQAWTQRTRRPKRRLTWTNQRADRNVPATTPPIVTTVVSRRNTLVGSTAISTPRPTAVAAKIAAHSQVAPRKNRSRPACGEDGR